MPSCDAIVVGGGHNGLVAAGLLAKAGKKVVLVEAGDRLGGAAVTEEFHPGFRASTVAHLVERLDEGVVQRLELERHGLAYAAATIPTTIIGAGAPLTLPGDLRAAVAGLPPGEAEAWPALVAKLFRFAEVLKPFLAAVPPRLKGGGPADWLTLGKLGLGVRRLGRDDMREFLRMVLMNVADVVEEDLTDERLKAVFAFDAVRGTALGPRSPNSLMALYWRLAAGANGIGGALALPKGGMGGVVAALAAAARAAGVTIRTSAPVERILVEGGRAVGVALAGGEEIRAPVVASAANPVATLMRLVGPAHLDIGLVRRLRSVRSRGNVARVLLALDGPPPFAGLGEAELRGRILALRSLDALEAAFDAAKYGAFSPEPALEITIPSLTDPALAPPGGHVVSISALYAPAVLKDGWNAASRAGLLAAVTAVLERVAPGIGARVVGSEVLAPPDIEARFGIPGGHWHHGELAIDQMFMLRPVPALAQYATPVEGLYLCGAGSHPGGGVSGLPAMNAVGRILAARGK